LQQPWTSDDASCGLQRGEAREEAVNVQLDWQAANDDGKWESIAQAGTRTRLRFPGWVWHVAAAVVVLFIAGSAIVVGYRYRRALRRVTAQIQDVVDLEARALAQGDVARYLSQQDTSPPGWVAQQAARIGRECPEVAATAYAMDDFSTGVCPLAAPVQVARVEMRGDVAWVEVVQPHQRSLRQVRFYRQTCQGWLHTAPHAGFWQHPVELVRGRVLVRAHRRDLPYLGLQVAHIVEVVDDVCAVLDCPADVGLEIGFTHHDVPPRLSGGALMLASPWLTGVPVDDARDESSSHALTYWVVYGLASQMVRPDYDERWRPNPAYPHYARREDLLHACATLYSRGGRHGEDAPPEMLGPMQDACRPRGFVTQ
jgi:hypothetical protein